MQHYQTMDAAPFSSLAASRDDMGTKNKKGLNESEEKDTVRAQSFRSCYRAEVQYRNAQPLYYNGSRGTNQLEQKSSVVSKTSRTTSQQLPEFAQIDQTGKATDFIDGFEKFTQEIQDFIVTKDEQMQNLLINDRRPQYKALQLIEENRLTTTRPSVQRQDRVLRSVTLLSPRPIPATRSSGAHSPTP